MKRAIVRILMIPVIVVMCAWSFPNLDAWRRAHLYAWLDPRMEEHWKRLFNPQHPDYGSFFHSGKNIMSEWCDLDGQRAGKLFSFFLCLSLLLNVILFSKWV